MYICVTHVDSKTKVPCFRQPMANGPSFPNVKGLNIEWWDASNWPLTHPDQYPRFYGTCDDDADTSMHGVIEILSEDRYNTLKLAEEEARLPAAALPSQFRLALLKKEMYSNVMSAIETIEEPLKSALKIDLEFALSINKNSTVVTTLTQLMNWDNNTVNDLFVTASNIDVSSFDSSKPVAHEIP